MKHPEHICRFNDAPQSCTCYDSGWDDAIQSVRERIEARMIDQSPRDKHDTKCGHCGGFPTICGCKEYNQALTDLLKDLEAPVEGEHWGSEPVGTNDARFMTEQDVINRVVHLEEGDNIN